MVDQSSITAKQEKTELCFYFTKNFQIQKRPYLNKKISTEATKLQYSNRELAIVFGCSHSKINTVLKNRKILYRQRFGRASPNKSANDLQKERKYLRLIKYLYEEKKSLRQIAKHLNENQIPTPSKKGKWFPSTIRRLIQRIHD